MAAGTSSGGVTKKLSTYTTAVLNYTIADNPGSTTYTIKSIKLTSSRSGGTPSAWSCSYWAGRSNASSASGKADSNAAITNAEAAFTSRRATAASSYSGQVSAITNYTIAKGSTTNTRTINYSFTVNKTHSTQSLPKFTLDFNFMGSNSDSALYYWTEAISRTVPAKDSYTVSYNLNGGSGTTPANQTKWYGETLTLTSFVPTKAGYNFGGWKATNNTVYQKGGSYTANAATTLTAVWNPKPPSLTISDAYRIAATTSSSYSLDEEDEGTDCVVVADYMWSKALSNPTVTISSTMTDGSGTSKTVTFSEHASVTGNDTADMYGGQIAFHSVAANLGTDARYTGTITIDDGTNPSLAVSFTIREAFFTVDWRDGGHGMGIGGPATGDGLYIYSSPVIIQYFAGIIQMFAGATPPNGWLVCDGSAVSRTTYSTLFAVIGTTWGTGDGSTTFNLPDLRGRAPIGAGTGTGLTARTLGTQNIGAETHKLTAAESGNQAQTVTSAAGTSHSHGANGDTHFVTTSTNEAISRTNIKPGTSTAITNVLRSPGGALNRKTATSGESAHKHDVTIAAKNATNAHNNMQPSAVVNFIICTGKTS